MSSTRLEPTRDPRWYIVRNMHSAVLEARVLPRGTDLKRAFVAAMLEHIDAGWQLGEFGSRGGVFFCTRGTERRMICITPSAPGHLSLNFGVDGQIERDFQRAVFRPRP